MDFSSRLLEQFIVLSEERHFGRAAERLSMSQPPLSQAMRRLERGLGVMLFERGAQGARLTAAGVVFAEDAKRLLESQAGAVERVRRVAKGLEGTLHMGFIPSAGYWFVPRLIAIAAAELPGLCVQLRQRHTTQLVDEVRSGILDIAFAGSNSLESEGLEIRLCVRERVCVNVPLGHRLARERSVRLADLADEDFVLPSSEVLPSLHGLALEMCLQAGFVPRVRIYAGDMPSMISYTAAGLGVSFATEPAATMGFGMVSTLVLEGSDTCGVSVFSLHRPGADAAIVQFLDLIHRRRSELECRRGE